MWHNVTLYCEGKIYVLAGLGFMLLYLCFVTRFEAVMLKYVHNGAFYLHGSQTLTNAVPWTVAKRKECIWMALGLFLGRKS